jgi:hypothetical protein
MDILSALYNANTIGYKQGADSIDKKSADAQMNEIINKLFDEI